MTTIALSFFVGILGAALVLAIIEFVRCRVLLAGPIGDDVALVIFISGIFAAPLPIAIIGCRLFRNAGAESPADCWPEMIALGYPTSRAVRVVESAERITRELR